jgi:hypothetical protein
LTDDITGQFPLISNSVLMYLQAQIKKLWYELDLMHSDGVI